MPTEGDLARYAGSYARPDGKTFEVRLERGTPHVFGLAPYLWNLRNTSFRAAETSSLLRRGPRSFLSSNATGTW